LTGGQVNRKNAPGFIMHVASVPMIQVTRILDGNESSNQGQEGEPCSLRLGYRLLIKEIFKSLFLYLANDLISMDRH